MREKSSNEILPWEFTSLLKEVGFSIIEQGPSQFLVDAPPEVRKWLNVNPCVAMCIALWRTCCQKRSEQQERENQV